jgi:uncharacterized protein with HEPN domain
MQPEVAKLLRDIVVAGESVQQFTSGVSFDEYEQSPMLRMAVERQMITVGEALSVALKIDPTLRHRVTEARDIVDFRNMLVHGYSLILDDRVWGAIVEELPLLLSEVRSLLSAT